MIGLKYILKGIDTWMARTIQPVAVHTSLKYILKGIDTTLFFSS